MRAERANRAPIESGTSTGVPAEHAQGAQRVPPARSAQGLVQLDRHYAGILRLEGPASFGVALRRDQLDRLAHAFIWRGAGAAQVVEPTQHVVVPPRRE